MAKWNEVGDKFEKLVKDGSDYQTIMRECKLKNKSEFNQLHKQLMDKDKRYYEVPGMTARKTQNQLKYNEKYGLRVSPAKLAHLNIQDGTNFEISFEDNKIILEPK